MEDIQLLKIHYHVMKYSICNIRGIYRDIINKVESMKICPHYPFMKFFMTYAFTPLKSALRLLEENICFLDIDVNPTTCFILSCDWCSMCNGILETAKKNIIRNPGLLDYIDFKKLAVFNKYMDFCLADRKKKLTNQQIEGWCETTFGKITIDLLLFSQIYLKVEQIELRWCPYKRSKESYYRNKDKRYLDPTERTIHEVGRILYNHETITCSNCPKVVNKKWKYTKSNKQSTFQPLLDYMITQI